MTPEWRVEPGLTPYAAAVATMEARVAAIRERGAREHVWLVEHPALYTAGTSAHPADLLDPARLPVHATGRGGRHTWHGPGQRVVYTLLDLDRRGRDLRRFVAMLERWIIAALAPFGIAGEVRPGLTGVWVGPAKIAAIGVRVRRWVSYHGLAINVAPDLAHYAGIRPCGLDAPVTSMAALGAPASMAALDRELARTFPAALAWMNTNLTPVQPIADPPVSLTLEAWA